MSQAFLARAGRRAGITVRDAVRFGRDAAFGTTSRRGEPEIERVMNPIPRSVLLSHEEALLTLAKLTLEHRFDLLGSGWIKVNAPEHSRINGSNRAATAALRKGITKEYQRIDWQCDFKSGYRWSERKWHRHIRFGDLPGVDVKVPWELARMQHLPRLALAYGIEPEPSFVGEFRNEVLDFAAFNPPRYGVNWFCAMDVAIRAANWLVAYDLFRTSGAPFDSEFRTTFARLILEHGRYVRTHLERRGKVRNNHYLAGIAGLIFIGAYLRPSRETKNWLRFATGELIRELEHQFHPDGSNFEGSTSYHRLSGEMVIFATALLAGLPKPPEFPAWFCERLARIAGFTRALQMPNGEVPQIGDNDSGRFLHLTPMYRKISVRDARSRYLHLRRYEAQPDSADYWDLQDGNHSHLVEAADALLQANEPENLEGVIIRSLARGRYVPNDHRIATQCEDVSSAQTPLEGQSVRICKLNVGHSPLGRCAFPDFGVYVFRNREFFLSIRCGGVAGAHAHDDQLSIELHHRGEALFRDPGTFVYTPYPELRRRYRSLAAHAVPYPMEDDTNSLVFQTRAFGCSECIHFAPDRFVGFGRYGSGYRAYREVRFADGILEITDFLQAAALAHVPERIPYSPGYGKLLNDFVNGKREQLKEISQCVY